MSFYVQVCYAATKTKPEQWEEIVSSASHMMDLCSSKSYNGKKLSKVKLPNGDTFDCTTGRWKQAPRNPNFI